MSTGQIVESDCIDNYPGLPNIEGYELGEKFKAHAQAYGTEFIEDEVIKIEKSANGSFVIKFKSDNLLSVKAIIYAAGASHRKLGIDGESHSEVLVFLIVQFVMVHFSKIKQLLLLVVATLPLVMLSCSRKYVSKYS